jgi:hypothetical protein
MKSFVKIIILICLGLSIYGVNEQIHASINLDSEEKELSSNHQMVTNYKTSRYRLCGLGDDPLFPFTFTGFSDAEPEHRWTEALEATIIIPLLQNQGRISRIRFNDTFGLISNDRNQRLTVSLNNKDIGHYVYNSLCKYHTIEVPFSSDLTGDVVLKFSMPLACVVDTVGIFNGDSRLLAIGFRTAEVTFEHKLSYHSMGLIDKSCVGVDKVHSPVKLLNGFSDPEANFRWTDGDEAVVQVDVSNQNGKIKRIEFETFGLVSHNYSQALIVFLNNVYNSKYVYDQQNPMRVVVVDIPSSLTGIAAIKFEMPYACKPCNLFPSNLDPRKLAIGFKAVSLISDPDPVQTKNEQDQQKTEEEEQKNDSTQTVEEKEAKDKQLKELEARVQELEEQFMEQNGVKSLKIPGCTILWLPFSSPSFVHTDRLLTVPDTSELTVKLKAKLSDLKEAFATVKVAIKDRAKVLSLKELDLDDVSSFAEVKLKSKDEKSYPSLEHVMTPCGALIAEATALYDEYEAIVSKVPDGLEKYSKSQITYAALVKDIEQICTEETKLNFFEFMNAFNQKKSDFVDGIKMLMSNPDAQPDGYHKLIDLVELEFSSSTLSEFTRAFTTAPDNPNIPGFSDFPFIVMNQRAAGAGKRFEDIRFITRVHQKSQIEIPGFDKSDPFCILRGRKATSERLSIDIVESMYLLQYFNNEWNQLKILFGDIKNDLAKCQIPLMNPKIKATVNLILNNPNFLEKDKLTLVKSAKDLKELLKPILASEHEQTWAAKGHQNLRDNLKKLYTTYMALQKFGLLLNDRNPKIKEYHDENSKQGIRLGE